MNKEDFPIDDFFRSGLEGLPEAMEVPSWNKVRGNIDRKRAQRKIFYYSAAAAGVLLLLGSSIFLRSLDRTGGAFTPDLPPIASQKLQHTLPIEKGVASRPTGTEKRKKDEPFPTTAMRPGKARPATLQALPDPSHSSNVEMNTPFVPGKLPETVTAHTIPAPKQLPDQIFPDGPTPADDINTRPHKRTVLAGITVGYQKGFNAYAVNAPVISSFFQVNLNDKFALSVQPALAYNNVQKTSLGSSVYHANVATQVQQTTETTPDGPIYNYSVNLSYDSVQVGYAIGSGYWQAEIPLYAHYKVSRRLSFFTGMALRYTGAIPITQQVSQTPVSQSYVLENQPQYLPQGVIDEIVSNAVPGTAYDPSTPDEMRQNGSSALSVTYGLGFKFQVNKRLGLEILGNKNLSGFKNISNKDLRSMQQQPGLRMSVVYHFNTPSGK